MADERTKYGGQAVVEGVMMRSPRFFAVACRKLSNGEIVIKREPVEKHLRGVQWLNKPFLRGSLALIDAMAMGIKALTYAANVQAEDESEKPSPPAPLPNLGAGRKRSGRGEGLAAGAANLAMGEGVIEKEKSSNGTINGIAIGFTTVLSLVIGFALFWTLPAVLAKKALPLSGSLLQNLAEGGIRLAFFFAYILLISQMKHIQRVFQYHGAEHKAINTLESGLPMTLDNAREASRIHPRCGTNFIFIVLVTSVFVFALLPRHSLLEIVGLRLLCMPIVAGIAFEILKWAGANRNKAWAQALIAPGLWTQLLTTRIPDDSQIEVAIAALNSVWAAEHEGTNLTVTDLRKDRADEEPAAAVA